MMDISQRTMWRTSIFIVHESLLFDVYFYRGVFVPEGYMQYPPVQQLRVKKNRTLKDTVEVPGNKVCLSVITSWCLTVSGIVLNMNLASISQADETGETS